MNALTKTITGFDHVGIPCRDIEETKQWYTQKLGFEVVHEPEVATGEGVVKVAFLRLGTLMLEFYQLLGADYREVLSRTDGPVDHFALAVNDVDEAFSQAKALGLEPMEEAPVHLDFWDKGIAYFKIRGPGGEIVEFIQTF